MEEKKKGFTLIELLAIIVILAVIAVITVPIILGIIDEASGKAAINSAYGFNDSIVKGYLTGLLSNGDEELSSGTFTMMANGSMTDSDSHILTTNVSGNYPEENSWVELDRGQVVAYSLKFGDYVVTKYRDTSAVAVKGGTVAENTAAREARLEGERQASAKAKALQKVNTITISQAGATEIQDITENDEIIGWVAFIEGTLKKYSIKISEGVYIYIVSDTDINSTNSNQTADRTKTELDSKPVLLSIGSPVCFGPTGQQECFKVIATNSSTTTLLADNNLKKYTDNTTNPATVTYKQTTSSPDSLRFSSTNYWHDATNNVLKSEYAKDINGVTARYAGNPYPYIYNLQGSDTNNVKPYVDGYLATLKTEIYGLPATATGRLLTYEEASSLSSSIARGGGLYGYWLGSAKSFNNAWHMKTDGTFDNASYTDPTSSVRPIIIIPTSDIPS